MQTVSKEQQSEQADVMPGVVSKAKLNSFGKARPRLISESGAILHVSPQCVGFGARTHMLNRMSDFRI